MIDVDPAHCRRGHQWPGGPELYKKAGYVSHGEEVSNAALESPQQCLPLASCLEFLP